MESEKGYQQKCDFEMTCWALSGVETTQVKLKLLLCGVEICLFLLDRTARINTKKILTCRGSFGGFETTCFQLDRAASFKTTKISTSAATDPTLASPACRTNCM